MSQLRGGGGGGSGGGSDGGGGGGGQQRCDTQNQRILQSQRSTQVVKKFVGNWTETKTDLNDNTQKMKANTLSNSVLGVVDK